MINISLCSLQFIHTNQNILVHEVQCIVSAIKYLSEVNIKINEGKKPTHTIRKYKIYSIIEHIYFNFKDNISYQNFKVFVNR